MELKIQIPSGEDVIFPLIVIHSLSSLKITWRTSKEKQAE